MLRLIHLFGGRLLALGAQASSSGAVAPPSYTPALKFDDARNSMYLPAL